MHSFHPPQQLNAPTSYLVITAAHNYVREPRCLNLEATATGLVLTPHTSALHPKHLAARVAMSMNSLSSMTISLVVW